MRESDGTYFLWNGEGCVRVSCVNDYSEHAEIPKWHHDYGELPQIEILMLNGTLSRPRTSIFSIKDHGRYRVIARGEFK